MDLVHRTMADRTISGQHGLRCGLLLRSQRGASEVALDHAGIGRRTRLVAAGVVRITRLPPLLQFVQRHLWSHRGGHYPAAMVLLDRIRGTDRR